MRREREKNMSNKNMRRKEATYKVDDFVLVRKQRFPNMKMNKFGIQWHGPFRIVKVYPSAVKVRASPRLGGEIMVAHSMLKRFPLDEGWEEEEDAEEEWELVEEKGEQQEGDNDQERAGVDDIIISDEDMKNRGVYVVERILKHKFMGEWRFLVKWGDPYTIKDCTWEPIDSFIVDNGWLNETFVDYCKEKKLDEIMSIARKKAARRLAQGSR